MPRQPYSVAVLSTGGRLHPRFLRFLSPGNGGTEGVVKTIEKAWLEVELSLQVRRRGRKNSFFNGKEGRVGFRKTPSFLVFKLRLWE